MTLKNNPLSMFASLAKESDKNDDSTKEHETQTRSTAYIECKVEMIHFVTNKLRNAAEVLTSYRQDKIDDESAILTLMNEIEPIRTELRTVAPKLIPKGRYDALNVKEKLLEDVRVMPCDNGYFQIEMYPLVSMPSKGGYNCYFEVKEAVKTYIKSNPFVPQKGKRYTLIYKRIVTGNLSLAKGRCDNDNFETKRVTNAITDALGIADSVDIMSFFYTTELGDKDKMVVILKDELQY